MLSLVAGAMIICSVQATSQAQDVAASASLAKPLSVGAQAPDADLRTVDSRPISLKTALHDRPTILIFYRGGWCPFCNAHLSDLVRVEPELRNLGYQLLAISPDRPEELRKMIDKDHLTYTLLSDSKVEAIRRFGVAFRVDDATLQRYSSFGIDLERSSGQAHHVLPVPSVFIIDRGGTIRYVHANPDYKVRLKGEEVLQAARDVKR